MYQQQH
jgi:hypothetical protein